MPLKNRQQKDPELVNCPNHYTEHSIYDLFMESEEETSVCSSCPNLRYVAGTMTCKYLDRTTR